MQNERSGARKQRKVREGEVLSPAEQTARDRGERLKRYIRAAAALQGLYDDTSIADAADVQRGAVAGWWLGSQMKPATIERVADALDVDPDELMAYVYRDAPPPALPGLLEVGRAGADEGHRRASRHRGRPARGMHPHTLERRAHASEE